MYVVYLHVPLGVYTCVHACRGQRLTSGVFNHFLALSFEIGSLTEHGTHQLARMAAQGAPAILLSLPPQYWDYTCLAFY